MSYRPEERLLAACSDNPGLLVSGTTLGDVERHVLGRTYCYQWFRYSINFDPKIKKPIFSPKFQFP